MKALLNSLLFFVLLLLSILAFASPGNHSSEGEPMTEPSPRSQINRIYQKVRQSFLKLYAPIVREEAQLDLKIKLNTEVPNYFGGMNIEDGSLNIILGSKAHLEPSVTPDSYRALLCHEVGHRLAGAPFGNRPGGPAWSSAEGQCDYYAALTCLPKIFAEDPETQEKSYQDIPQIFHQKCHSVSHGNPLQTKICLRTIQAGAQMMASIYSIYEAYPSPPPRPDLLTPEAPDKSVGSLYPSMQCRLDTYVAGALKEARPSCWFSEQTK